MRLLIAYASKRGSTAEIAEAMAGTLRRAGLEVDCAPAGEVESLDGYEAVILGSAVYMKRWRGEARHFLRKHRKALAKLPFWVFSSGPVGDPENDQLSWTEPRKTIEAAEKLGMRGHVVFGGALPAEPHGPLEKAMVSGSPPEFRDRRDWDEIRAWASSVARALSSGDRAQIARTQ